jgi:hypothetical protein
VGLSPEWTCRFLARECDLYIGIFGDNDGSVPRGLGMSPTAMEYREARDNDQGKILIYVQDAQSVERRQ